MDIEGVLKQVQQFATEQQEDLTRQARLLVEQQYCSTHRKFAEFQGLVGELGSEDGVVVRFTTCCDDLNRTIRSLMETGFQE